MDFTTYDTTFDAYKAGLAPWYEPGLNVNQFYRALFNFLGEHASFNQKDAAIEKIWYDTGAPLYRVSPTILPKLMQTSLEIPCKHIRLPFEGISISVPKNTIRDDDPRAPYLQGFIVVEVERENVTPRRTWALAAKFNDFNIERAPEGATPDDIGYTIQVHTFQLGMVDENTVDDQFNAAKNCYDHPSDPRGGLQITEAKDVPVFDDGGYWPSRPLFSKMFRLAVAVAAFATGLEKKKLGVQMVEEIKLSRPQRRRIERGEEPKTRHFDVGRVLELPRPEASPARDPDPALPCVTCSHEFQIHGRGTCPVCGCVEFDTGRHLTAAHIRSGHVHWFKTGARQGPNDWVMKWVMPTIVRPDLPFKTEAHTPYEIK